jgi:hypothetical protein
MRLPLADLRHASHLHDRTFLLPRSESCGLVIVDIRSTELLAVSIEESGPPVTMLAAAIPPERCGLAFLHLREYYHDTFKFNKDGNHIRNRLSGAKNWPIAKRRTAANDR